MENKTIEALEKLVALKDETIKELERQIQLLKNQPPVVVPQVPIQPFAPSPQPYSPFGPSYPTQPWQTPYIITSDRTTGAITIAGDPLPLGSVQMGSMVCDKNSTLTLTNADGSTNVININEVAHTFKQA